MVGRGLGWQISDFFLSEREKKYSEIIMKKGNPTFLPWLKEEDEGDKEKRKRQKKVNG